MTSIFLHSRDRIRRYVKSWTWLCLGVTFVGVEPERDARADTFDSNRAADTEGEQPTASFAGTFALDAERRALDLGGQPRQRSLRRLLGLSHRIPSQVAELLDQWLSSEPKLSPTETWAVLRPVAALGAEPSMRQYLSKALAGEALAVESTSGHAPPIAEVAALALAKHPTPESLALLADWLRRPSERATMVRNALLTHPPLSVSPLLDASGPATPLLLQTLGDLGDEAAIPYLRQVVKRATADVQAAAAVALAKLGVSETQDLAALWLSRSDSPPLLLQASAFVMLRFQHPARAMAFERLARSSLALALDLAEQVPPDPALLPLAERLTEMSNAHDQRRAVRIVGGIGAPAFPQLVALMKERSDLRWEVARTLGERGAPHLSTALRPLLATPETRPAALSVLVVLAVRHPGVNRIPLMAELESSSRSAASAERGLARTGLAVLDEQHARRYLTSEEVGNLSAAAIAAAVHGPSYLRACVLRLEQLAQSELASGVQISSRVLALSSVLSFVSPRDSVSSRLLRALASSPYPVADTARWQAWVRRGPDADSDFSVRDDTGLARAQLAAALHAPRHAPSAFTLLDSLGGELDPEVRAATVKALRPRTGARSVSEALDWSANYDPSPLVRKLAAAEVTDESVLRALWVTHEPTFASDFYWVAVVAADRAPVVLYWSGGPNALVFIRSPSLETSLSAEGSERTTEATIGEPTLELGVIPFHVEAIPHPSPNPH